MKPHVRSELEEKFRNLIAAEELLQATIQALESLGAAEFTPGLSQERDRLLARLEALQNEVYAKFNAPSARCA